jgi:secreted trypsin-like serine protease
LFAAIDSAHVNRLIGVMVRTVAAALLVVLVLSPAVAMVGGAAPADGVAGRALVMVAGSRGNLCTGTALASDLVLTAAHCVAPVATYSIALAKGGSAMAIRTIVVHPRYEPQAYALSRATADVALLKLAAPLPGGIAAAAIDRGGNAVAVGDNFVVAGFGVTAAGGDAGVGVARIAALVATGQPGSLQIRLFDPATKGERPGLGACTGDSGAPVFRDLGGQNLGGRLAVMGVVSWSTGPKNSEGCGGLTGVTPLARYRDWIVQTAGKFGSPLP